MNDIPQNNSGIHFYSKHKYRDTFGDAHIQYHDFDNPLSTGDLSKIANFMSSLIGGPIKMLLQCRFSH